MNNQRTLPAETIERMVRETVGDSVKQYTLASNGSMPVFYIDTEGGEQYVLKAAGSEEAAETSAQARSIRVEARLVTALKSHTSIPVPSVVGVVDDMSGFGLPFFVMEAIDGATIGPKALSRVDDLVLEEIAFQIGEHVADLHSLSTGMSEFGYLGYEEMELLAGEIPNIELERFSVRDGYDTWFDRFHNWISTDLNRFEKTPLAPLLPDIETALKECVAELPVDHHPVIGRVHQSIDNVLFDEATGEVQALIDWEPRHVVTAAFDLAVVEYSLSGGAWRSLPNIEDRLDLVHNALCAGYTNSLPLPDRYSDQRECYHLAQLVLSVDRLAENKHPLSNQELFDWFRKKIDEKIS